MTRRYTPRALKTPKISPALRDHVPWLVTQINEWRRRAEGISPRDRRELHPETFGDGLAGLVERGGIDAEFAAFIALGCEWLFRFRRFRRENEIRDRLREAHGPAAEAIKRAPTRDDGWMLACDVEPPELPTFLFQTVGTFGFHEDLPEGARIPGAQSKSPSPILGKRKGYLRVAAPWVAGVLIESVLEEQSLSRSGARATALRFVQALKDNADAKTFRDYARQLAAPSQFVERSLADDLLRDFRDCFARHSTDARDSNGSVLDVVKSKFRLEWPTFPYNDDVVRRLCDAHRTTGPEQNA